MHKNSHKPHALPRFSHYISQCQFSSLLVSMDVRGLRLVYKERETTFGELLTRDKLVNVYHKNFQILAKTMYKAQHGTAPGIMNDIFRKRNMYDNTRNSSGFETRNIETVHYGSETIVYLGTKIRDFVPQKIKDLENIHIFKLNMKFWKSDNFPCHLLKLREKCLNSGFFLVCIFLYLD